MKVNDTFPVQVAGIDTGAIAVIKDIDEDGRVTVEFPATRFVAQTRTEITADKPPAPAPARETIVDEVVRTPAPVESAPVEVNTAALDVDKPETPAEVPPAAETKE